MDCCNDTILKHRNEAPSNRLDSSMTSPHCILSWDGFLSRPRDEEMSSTWPWHQWTVSAMPGLAMGSAVGRFRLKLLELAGQGKIVLVSRLSQRPWVDLSSAKIASLTEEAKVHAGETSAWSHEVDTGMGMTASLRRRWFEVANSQPASFTLWSLHRAFNLAKDRDSRSNDNGANNWIWLVMEVSL